MIRWYATTGLVDRPVMRGRVAHYGERHLLQLVAVKRLQAQGLTLAEIQQRLAGATDATLRAAADGADPDGAHPTRRYPEPAVPRAARRNDRRADARSICRARRPRPKTQARFWASMPAAQVTATVTVTVTVTTGGTGCLYGLRIADLTLLLRSPPTDEDLPAIRAAARPLLDLLAAKT